ncbi:MAG TPA: lantibiotic dehydratase, partial [Pseudomonadota bacterium]|nr:lantibiotic dehydratase [Pseudomonadota bacterium]
MTVQADEAACEIFPSAMLRTPIRSYRRFLELGAAADLQQALLAAYREPLIRRALRVKSRSLFAAIERHERGAAPLDEDTLFSLYRYFVRITTRCTPLMLFAGVGAAAVGEFTQALQAGEADWRLGIFPSWNSILRVIRTLLQSAAVRHAARYRLNETVVRRGGVLCYFTEQEPEGSKILTPRYKIVSMRLDPQLLPLLGDPARWWSWSELLAV